MKYAPVVVGAAIVLAAGVACTGTPGFPTTPTAAVGGATAAANPDGSTLKVTAPALVSPIDDDRVDSRRPTFVWLNSRGRNALATGLSYELVVVSAAQSVVYTRLLGETTGSGTHGIELDLPFDGQFLWRIRSVSGPDAGPWSIWGSFRTPPAPVAPTTTPTGTIGPPRTMAFIDAYSMIINIHNGGRFNLGGGSTRDYRVAFLWGAVAAIHYGHARWNPQGPDSNWCVKDAGEGRPPSDDVLVRCSTRESWDLISSAGANGYSFHIDFIGILPSIQNVYPPPRSSLNFLPQ